MQNAIDVTTQRRKVQDEFNKEHNITPQSVERRLDENLKLEDYGEIYNKNKKLEKMPKTQRAKLVKELTKKMNDAAKALEFELAAKLRDEINKIKSL